MLKLRTNWDNFIFLCMENSSDGTQVHSMKTHHFTTVKSGPARPIEHDFVGMNSHLRHGLTTR